jgi:hypothetical protein
MRKEREEKEGVKREKRRNNNACVRVERQRGEERGERREEKRKEKRKE